MYRLSGPNIILYTLIVVVGIIICIITPHYFHENRILSFSALLLGEVGLSFIPVLALYPKATPIQVGLLAIIYFLTTFIICFSTWGINSLGTQDFFTFLWKEGEFHVNTYALFVINIFSLLALVSNFKLVYDEELTKEAQTKSKGYSSKGRPRFTGFQQKPLLKRPQFEEVKETLKPKYKPDRFFEEDFGKPFEFEPDITVTPEKLPEESTGKLFSPEIEEKPTTSEFFDDEGKTETTYQTTQANPFPPSDIKEDLALIFEQYSSLNAIKKLTSKVEKPYKKKKEEERKTRKPYELPKVTPTISVQIEGEEIHEASFRQISEAEKIEEIKEELKKEIQEKVTQETQKIEETAQKTSETKDEIIQSIKSIKEELTRDLQDKVEERIQQQAQKIEETAQKTSETKEEIIQSIKSIKEELIESIKEEIKKELVDKEEEVIPFKEQIKKEEELELEEEEEEEEDSLINLKLTNLNKTPKVLGSILLNKKGNIILEKWGEKQVLHKEIDSDTVQMFNLASKEINKTKQGSLYHLLLESQSGILVLAKEENKILTVCTQGTGEMYSGQILRALSELEDIEER